jgi:hypothetical protein
MIDNNHNKHEQLIYIKFSSHFNLIKQWEDNMVT